MILRHHWEVQRPAAEVDSALILQMVEWDVEEVAAEVAESTIDPLG